MIYQLLLMTLVKLKKKDGTGLRIQDWNLPYATQGGKLYIAKEI
jgi:hypothetical protein